MAGLLLAGAHGAAAARRVALVIGNGEYSNLTSLANPVGDARRLAEMLAANGFDVMSCEDGARRGCYDLTRSGLLDALDDFSDLANGADLAFVFYAGHGMQTDSGNVIAPTDIELDCGDWSAKREVLLDDVLEAMEGAREKIVVLDACRNDPFKARQCLQRGVRPLAFGSFAVPGSASRFLLLSSTQSGQLAADGLPGGHSPFADSLFRVMEASPRIGFDQLFDRVAKRVIETTAAQNFTQIPEILIRGGAPEACLAGDGCGGDPDAAALRRQVEELSAANAKNQDYERIVVALLESGGLDARTVGAEQKERFFETVMAAARSLAEKGDPGTEALAALGEGEVEKAEQVFFRDLALLQRDPTTDPRRVARSAAGLAAIAWARGDPMKAETLYEQALRYDPRDLSAWIRYAELLVATGRTDAARSAYERGRAVSAEGAPADRVWVVEGLADTYWNADPDRSLSLYREANAVAATLLKDRPDDSGLKRGLIVTHYNIGHLAMNGGDTATALREFRDGLEVAETLAAQDPTDLRWQYDLSRGHERLGRAYLAAGDTAAALQSFLRKQAIADRIARSGEATYVQDAALAEEFLADLAAQERDFATAELRYEASLAKMRPLSESAPAVPGFRRWISVTLLALGDVQVQDGKADAAWDSYAEAAQISEDLAASHRTAGQWRWDLFRAYQRLASTRPPGAEYHAKALETVEALKADGLLDPANEKWIAITRERLDKARAQEAEEKG